MTMNYEVLNETLEALGYSDKPLLHKAVVELAHTLDAQRLTTDEDRVVVAELFANILRNYSDGPKGLKGKEARWVPFELGKHRPGDTVRVRHDAYTEGAGTKHNGLVGTVSAIRGGRILVQYSGRSEGLGHNHHPYLLEVLEK